MTTKTIIDELVEKREGAAREDDDLDFNPVDPIVSPDSLFDPKIKAMYDAEPKKRVHIPEPDGWSSPHPYAERLEVNGIVYIITAGYDVMLPESVWGVWENRRQMNRLVSRQQQALRRIAQYENIGQVPHYVR